MKAIADALHAKLTGDATLMGYGTTGVFPGIPAEHVAAPFVTYQKSDGFDRQVFGARATMWTEWIIRAWDEGNSQVRAQQMAERIDALLDHGVLTVAGLRVLCIRRLWHIPDMAEEDSGLIVRSSGARYEIEVATV